MKLKNIINYIFIIIFMISPKTFALNNVVLFFVSDYDTMTSKLIKVSVSNQEKFELIIPSQIEGKIVTGVDEDAFVGVEKLITRIQIPETILRTVDNRKAFAKLLLAENVLTLEDKFEISEFFG